MSSIHKERSDRPKIVLASTIGWAFISFGGCADGSSPQPAATHVQRESTVPPASMSGSAAGSGASDQAAVARFISDPASSDDDDPNPPEDGDPAEPGDDPAAPGDDAPAAPSDGDPYPPGDDGSDQPGSDGPATPVDGDPEAPGADSADQPVLRFPATPTDISSTADVAADAIFEVREETYTLPDVQFELPGSEPASSTGIPVEMQGVIVAPVNAPGPRPLAVFIHGQHTSCYSQTDGVGIPEWPCTEGRQPVPSYRGYLDYQRFLAAAGWVTVSVSANGIGGSPLARLDSGIDIALRTQLVEAHLRQWDAWIHGSSTVRAPEILAVVTPDLTQLLLVGHSRGGSTANQVALRSVTDPTSPWRARAQVLIAPTAENYNPAPTVPVVVLLPGCDGDVTDLQGQSYIDRVVGVTGDSALRTSVFIGGANHNFFNSEWDPSTATAKGVAADDAAALFETQTPADGTSSDGTPADGSSNDGTPADGTPADGTPADGTPADGSSNDGTPADGTPTDGTSNDGTAAGGAPAVRTPADAALDGACRPGAPQRLGGEQQRELGTFFIAAAAKALVEGESALLPLVDGSLVCGGPSCDPHVLTHALGGLRQPVLIPRADSVAAGSAVTPCLTTRETDASACITADMPRFKDRPRTPHFGSAVKGNPNFESVVKGNAMEEPTDIALRMDWKAPGTPVSIRLNHPLLDQDVSLLDIRVIVAPDAVDTTFALSLVDSAGRELSLGSVAMSGVPANAGGGSGVYWAQNVRLPLDRSTKIDFGTLEQLRITPKSASGLIWVLDAWGYKPGPAARSGSPARFELSTRASSVDANGVMHVTGNVFGELTEDAEFYYYADHGEQKPIEGRLRIPAHSRSLDLPFRIPADTTGTQRLQLLGSRASWPRSVYRTC